MKKIILEKLIYKNYLKTALTSILFIEVVLIIIYFSASNSMIKTSMDFVLKDINSNVTELVKKEMQNIENKFREIEVFAKILQNEHQVYFKNPHKHLERELVLKQDEEGVLFKPINNGGSSVVVLNNKTYSHEIIEKVKMTEAFDITFKSIVDNEPDVVAVYFNSHDNINRYYPYMDNVNKAYPIDMNIPDYNFYYEADLKNNPSKGVVWTEVYLDPAGKGWLLSAIVPIYNDEFLEGVTGIDVTVSTFVKNFLNLDLPYEGTSFIVNKNGKIVAMTKDVEKILDIEEVSEYKYQNGEVIKKTILKSEKFNILKYHEKEVRDTFKEVLNGKAENISLIINQKEYLLFTKELDRTSWFVVSLIEKDKIASKVLELENIYDKIGYGVVIFVVFFYIVFFIFLYSKAKALVKIINTPLLRIIEMTKSLGSSKEVDTLKPCGIEEIDKLSENFNDLSNELTIRTEKLIHSETQRVINEKLANTDSLTGVYNRRYLKDFSLEYMKIVKREKEPLSLLIVDIDKFKTINDSYGHDIGDKIIVNLVKRMREVLRDNDLIVRFGGDEFIVLLPNTKFSSAQKVGQKLIDSINEMNQLENKKLIFTISVGASTYEDTDEDIETIIKRADKALYRAKESGRNCIK